MNGPPTFGATFQYGTRVSGQTPVKVGLRGGVEVTSGESLAEVITASDLGYFFENAVA